MKLQREHLLILLIAAACTRCGRCDGAVVVNEVAYRGSAGTCGGEDWIELWNAGNFSVDLTNFTLHDDKGPDDDDAKVFGAAELVLTPGEFVVLCRGGDRGFSFGIGSDDSVTLLNTNGTVSSTSGMMPGAGSDDQTYARKPDFDFAYTSSPTPGYANEFSTPEITQEARLAYQNTLGREFFRLHDNGTLLHSTFAEVLDLHIELSEKDLQYLQVNASYEQYVSVTRFTVVSDGIEVAVLPYGGRVRTKGQSTLVFPPCLGFRNVPFSVDFDSNNASQTLFGLEKAYLRNHLSDTSYMREYAAHRLNARFGLPFLRTRAVRVFFNDMRDPVGLYTLTEAPDQAYVMQRSFGEFDPTTTALFKFKSQAAGCGQYAQSEVDAVANEPLPNPYYFERGEHRDSIPEMDDASQCTTFFWGQVGKDRVDTIKGWLAYDKNCSRAMVELGLVDRDFGPKANLEDAMIDFLNSYIYVTEPDSGLVDAIDADQWLKNLASYAVLVNMDSPLNNLNNWYIATTTGGRGDWRIVQYDHNNILTRDGAGLCAASCASRQIFWPILRPSCRSNEAHPIVGPLLANESGYLAYVAAFTHLLTDEFFAELRGHGEAIKDFVVSDPSPSASSEEDYAATQLSAGVEGYNTLDVPFIKALEARREQILAQLDAVEAGTMPRDGIYLDDEVCPDWRDSDGENYIASDVFVGTAPNCPADCEAAAVCFNYGLGICQADGTISNSDCFFASLYCRPCFPYSPCGSADSSGTFQDGQFSCNSDPVASSAGCQAAAVCFSTLTGECSFNGEMYLESCKEAEPCGSCYTGSRCSDSYTLAAAHTSSLSETLLVISVGVLGLQLPVS